MKINARINHVATGHNGAIYSLAINRQDGVVYSGSGDGMVAAWQVENGNQIRAIAKNESAVFSLFFNEEKDHIYIGDQKGYLHVIDTKSNALLFSSQMHELGLYTSLFHKSTNAIVTGGGDGFLNQIDADLFHIKTSIPLSNHTIRNINFDLNNNQLIAGSSDNNIYIVNSENYNECSTLNQHKNSVFSICSIGSDQFISSGRDAEICVWSLEENGSFSLDKVIPAHLMTVNSLRLSPNGKLFTSTSRDKTIKIWRAKDQQLLKVLDVSKFEDMHTHSINDIAWHDSNHFISAGDDKKLLFWEIEYNTFA